jgi:CBS domain-containing protein
MIEDDDDPEDEAIAEELRIMQERGRPARVLSAEVFEQPLALLCTRPVTTLDAGATIGDAVTLMRERRFGSVLVTDEGKLCGIVTERDILRRVVGVPGASLAHSITEAMTPDPEALMRTDTIAFAMNKMHVGGFRHVPIVSADGTPEHVISIRDLIAFVLDHFPERILNVPTQPYRGERRRESE